MTCAYDERVAVAEEVQRVLRDTSPCVGLSVYYPAWSTSPIASPTMCHSGISYCSPYGDTVFAAMRLAEAALAGLDLSCFRDGSTGACGRADDDAARLDERVRADCPEWLDQWYGARFWFDEDGRASGITSDTGLDPAAQDCLLASLRSALYPCLAGATLCPYPVDWGGP